MAKSSSKSGGTKAKDGSSSKASFDKIAKAAMSREMLAAGLTAAAAAIAASPKARRAIRDAGMDAADSASAAATTMVSSASKLGSLIAEAVADAAQRVLSGKWTDDDSSASSSATGAARKSTPARKTTTARKAPAARKGSAMASETMAMQARSIRSGMRRRIAEPSTNARGVPGESRFGCHAAGACDGAMRSVTVRRA